ncbi:HTH-type transcriptional activator TipA [Corynebacterium felinum]|nr:HTH-type transcriptional activator TipA [Corynebacterium felinum]
MVGMHDKTVGEVAAEFGLTVRTLHYWDEIGLLSPSFRSWQDHRLYTADDVARLRSIVIFRAIGMPLRRIAELVDADSSVDVRAYLRAHKALLEEKKSQIDGMLCAIDELLEKEFPVSTEDISAIMGPYYRAEDEAEAQQQWGHTEEWRISQRTKHSMSRDDWAQLRERTEAVEQELAEAFARGIQPGSAQANALAEKHRAVMSAFFPMTLSKHRIIAQSYTADPRIQSHYDSRAVGLAQWLQSIIEANANAQDAPLGWQ